MYRTSVVGQTAPPLEAQAARHVRALIRRFASVPEVYSSVKEGESGIKSWHETPSEQGEGS